MPPMQDVEHAVGHNQRARQRRDARQRIRCVAILLSMVAGAAVPVVPRALRVRSPASGAVLENLDDTHDAFGRRGDLGGSLAFGSVTMPIR